MDHHQLGPPLAHRGQTRLASLSPFVGYDEGFYDARTNPGGIINLSTAENSLMSDEVIEYMKSHFNLEPVHLKYRSALLNSTKTIANVSDALPRYLDKTLKPLEPIKQEQLVCGPGIGAIIANLVWHIADENDAILLTAPFYADYPRDIIYPAKAVPLIVSVPAEVDSLSPAVLPYIRKTIQNYHTKGYKTAGIILNNPHNPLARAYDVETIIGYASIAEEFDLHLIVDEVFANEVFSTDNPTPFVSILSLPQIASICSPYRIHILAGPTKDFGASGVKVGAMYSRNTALVKVITDSLSATPVSSVADTLFTSIMNDETYCDWFLQENRERLKNAYNFITRWLEFQNIPFTEAQACVFLLVDFAPVIDGADNEAVSVAIKKARDAKVLLRTPAHHCDPIPTRFRIVFTLPRDAMKIALQRLETAFGLRHFVSDK